MAPGVAHFHKLVAKNAKVFKYVSLFYSLSMVLIMLLGLRGNTLHVSCKTNFLHLFDQLKQSYNLFLLAMLLGSPSTQLPF